MRIMFRYVNGSQQTFPGHRVTPAGPRCVNPSADTIAEAMKNNVAWFVLSDAPGSKAVLVINPSNIEAIELLESL